MNQVFIYLLQVIAASALLYGYYHFALRNKKFHRYNRFYLLSAIVISVIIPFLNIPVYFTTNENDSSLVLQTLTVFFSPESYAAEFSVTSNAEKFAALFTISNMLYAVYIIIAIIFLSRIIISLNKIRTIVKNNSVEVLEKINFVSTDEPGTPFSFFRWLFWNRRIELKSEKGEQIFRHELFHIQQKHSLDIIFMELITVLFWINPFFHLMKKEVKAIHEFLADEFAINKNEKWQYAELLLMQALNTKTHLVNPFFHTLIKRRIAMITSSSKTSHQYLRKLLVLPVAALVVVLFAFSYKKAFNENSFLKTQNEISNQAIQDTIVPKNDSILRLQNNTRFFDTSKPHAAEPLIVINGKKMPGMKLKNVDEEKIPKSEIERINVLKDKTATDKYGEAGKNGVIEIFTMNYTEQTNAQKLKLSESKSGLNEDSTVFEKMEATPSFPGGGREWSRYLERNLNPGIPVKNGCKSGTYTVIVQFIVNKEGNITEIKSLTSQGFGMEEHVMDLIRKGTKWTPGINNGKNVNSLKIQAITFVIGDGKPDHSIDVSKKYEGKNYLLNEIWVTIANEEVDKIFEKVEVSPSFPGGDREWRRYLERNLDANLPLRNGLKSGSYTVIIQFIVDKEGNISDLKPLTKYGYGMEAHVMDMIKKGPKWIPGKQNGHIVSAYQKQPVTFVIIGNGKPNHSTDVTNKEGDKNYLNEVIMVGYGNEEKKIFEKLDIQPSFPGGDTAWRSFLQKNLDANVGVKNGAAEGKYKVEMQFVVNVDGTITDLKAITQKGYGMEEECLRIMKLSPKWNPGIQNGKKVNAYRKQPITFVIASEDDNSDPITTNTNNRSNSHNFKVRAKDLHNIDAFKPIEAGPKDEFISFLITIDFKKTGEIKKIFNEGSKLNNEIKTALKRVSAGDFVTIEDVRAKIKNEEKIMPPVFYTVY